jgi:hypothetical protein
MFAHTMAQIITTQFVGLVHGANENFANLVHLAFGKCGFKVTGPPSHEPFVSAQKNALQMGWGLNAAVRTGQAQAENVLPSTKTSRTYWPRTFRPMSSTPSLSACLCRARRSWRW